MIQKVDASQSDPPADPVVVGGTYIHWKHGREYVVEAVGMGNSDPFVGVDVVVYRILVEEPGDKSYARTRADFTALVTRDDGEVVRRFRRKPDAGGDLITTTAAAAFVIKVWEAFYLDGDRVDRDKEVCGGDLVDLIGGMFEQMGMVPTADSGGGSGDA